MKSIVINLTQKCNAKCVHCCFECLPNSSNYLTDDEIEKIVSYAESHDDVKVVSLTGGEALLRKNKVLEIIQRLSLVGKETTLISNAFWATTEAVTERILSELKLAGLNYLTISYDDYHAEYIPISNVKRLLTIIKKFDIEVALNMVVDRKHIGVDLLKDLGESVFGVRVTMVPASPVGRANDLNHNDLYFKTIEELELTCPATGWEFVVHHDGYVYPCCSPSVFESNLRIGSIAEYEVEKLESQLYSNILLYILKKEGFKWFIEKMHLDLSKQKFVSSCEVCRFIFSDMEKIRAISNDIKDYYEENFENV
ncbi:molybdenum cofactor biosynthesis protein A [Streptococcus lutetiensis]|uniref:YydG family radical SAM peptide epimerase n=1 Tax=Streptococcus lutetiensis TaxID=150055 RepID=UPI000F6FB11E|nr:YydG family radical SAM peptide epimerase [Streptococcus lutetiensis]VEB81514.1 molybdenum cofactor biosynthesis protein A [Streptococcus lutetiensis]